MRRNGEGRSRGRWGLVIAPWLLIGGCAHTGGAAPEEAEAAPFRLGREDVVEVSVYKDPELTRTVPVRPDGRISLPIVGEVVAAGRTPDDVREEIVKKLREYVKDPAVVSLIVREVNSARFYVVGEVGKPGAYPLRGDVSALQGLALAGGLGEYSARDVVTVVRAEGGRRFTVELADLEQGRVRLGLHPGDTLVVR